MKNISGRTYNRINITADSEYVTAKQSLYTDSKILTEISQQILEYTNNHKTNCYIVFGELKGNYAPAFAMKILGSGIYGHMKIEVDVEINDNDTREHRCRFYVNSDLGAVERFGKRISNLGTMDIGTEIILNGLM